MLAFLPWVSIAEEVTLNGITLRPVDINDSDFDEETLNQVQAITEPYSLSPIYDSRIRQFTLIFFENGGILDDIDEEGREFLFLVSELLKISAISKREYFTHHPPYFNTNNFQLIIQRFSGDNFDVAIENRRRDGSRTTYTPEGQYRHYAPVGVERLVDFNFDIELFSSLLSYYSDDLDGWEKVYDSILTFNLANTDGESRDTTELILSCGAFEQILSSRSNYMDFSEKFSDLFEDFPVVEIEGSDKELNQRINRFGLNYRRAWAADLYQLRGGVAHGAQSARYYNSSWIIMEHLLLSSYIYPLVLKLKLQALEIYELTETDQRNIFSIDYLLTKQDIMLCEFRGDPGTSNWRRRMSASRWAFLGRGVGE